MLKKSLLLVAASLSCLVGYNPAHGQLLDMSSLVQGEIAFQRQFYPWAWQQSVRLAQQIPDNAPLPFNAMTIHHANNQANAAWGGYVNSLYHQSARTGNVIGNWTNGAIRGLGYYYGPTSGRMFQLPWTHGGYNVGPYGNVYSGHRYDGWGTNLYPAYAY